MYAAGFRMDQNGEGIDIGVFEFRKLAVFNDLRRQRMRGGQLFENVGVGAWPSFGFLDNREAKFLKQDLRQLFRRTDVERMAGEFFDFLLKLREPLAVARAQFGESR